MWRHEGPILSGYSTYSVARGDRKWTCTSSQSPFSQHLLMLKKKRGRALKEPVSCQTRIGQFVKNRRSGATDTWGVYPFRSDIKGISLKPVIVWNVTATQKFVVRIYGRDLVLHAEEQVRSVLIHGWVARLQFFWTLYRVKGQMCNLWRLYWQKFNIHNCLQRCIKTFQTEALCFFLS